MINDDNTKAYDLGYYYDSSDNLLAVIAYTPDTDRDASARADLPADDSEVAWIDWWSDGQGGTVDTTKTKIAWARTFTYTPSE